MVVGHVWTTRSAGSRCTNYLKPSILILPLIYAMHLHTKISKVVNIWASKCNIFTCARPILFLSLRHEKLNTSPGWQSITPKMSSQSNVSAATACRCRFWTHFVHIFGQKSTVGGRCVTNGVGQTSAIWRIRDGLTGAFRSLTYKSWSSTNPGDNP